ncbi:hypothetical protein GQ53DRAFT_756472 [Thozetella sp. PMI_491]|nr:hypothetical protein GQ53DRAFT_756472 [Thozetella sp. PMI_491]
MAAPDGTFYMVTDVKLGFDSSPTKTTSEPWDIWVHKLASNLTTTVGRPDTSALIRSASELAAQGLNLEASSAFYYDGHYYLLFGMTCQNCAGYIYGYYATDPLGPYTDLGVISQDGCSGQNKGAAVLPTADGKGVVINSILGYRTGPTNHVIAQSSSVQSYYSVNNYIWHGDNHQAAASTYWFPLEFDKDHTIKNVTCASSVQVPLFNQTTAPPAPVPYQLDCRVRGWKNIVATYSNARLSSTLEFPVWQRTDNLGPTVNAGPVLNGNLNIFLTYADGATDTFSWAPSNISWAPAKISMDVTGKSIVNITLSTNASNGCYGTIVQPKVDPGSTYGSAVLGLGTYSIQQKSELYVYRW